MQSVTRAGLESLCTWLDALTGRPDLVSLRTALSTADLVLDDVAEWVRFGKDRYRRNLMRESPHYQALILCWSSGQRSPIHDHARSICGVRVLTGVATETIFEPSPCGQMKAVSSRDLPTGGVCVSQDSDTHQISNLQPAGTDLVTLHIYAPPLLRMRTFSLTGEPSDEFLVTPEGDE